MEAAGPLQFITESCSPSPICYRPTETAIREEMDVPRRGRISTDAKPLTSKQTVTSVLPNTAGVPEAVLQPRSSYKAGGRQSAHLQRSPRLCGWSAASRRCAGSPRSVCKRVGSRSGRSLCAHILNRSRGSAGRTGKLCPRNTAKRRHRRLEKAPSDTNGLLMLRTARNLLKT